MTETGSSGAAAGRRRALAAGAAAGAGGGSEAVGALRRRSCCSGGRRRRCRWRRRAGCAAPALGCTRQPPHGTASSVRAGEGGRADGAGVRSPLRCAPLRHLERGASPSPVCPRPGLAEVDPAIARAPRALARGAPRVRRAKSGTGEPAGTARRSRRRGRARSTFDESAPSSVCSIASARSSSRRRRRRRRRRLSAAIIIADRRPRGVDGLAALARERRLRFASATLARRLFSSAQRHSSCCDRLCTSLRCSTTRRSSRSAAGDPGAAASPPRRR